MNKKQAEADQYLLKFNTYEEYLDSLWTDLDLCNLRSVDVCRTIAENGYRACGETLKESEFEARRTAAYLLNHPAFRPEEIASVGLKSTDELRRNLAIRERGNRVGIISTIIFVMLSDSNGHSWSGYIDYSESLNRDDWKTFFHNPEKILRPKPIDLSYYNWRTGKCVWTSSSNYKVWLQNEIGPEVVLIYRFDRLKVNLRPYGSPGKNSYRKRVYVKPYDIIMLIDHVIRKRI